MGQADAAPTMPRYDSYLRRVCAERALNLCDRNYGYRVVSDGGIVERQLGVAGSPVFVREPFNDGWEFSDLLCRRREVETNKRNFDFRSASTFWSALFRILVLPIARQLRRRYQRQATAKTTP